MPKKKKIIQERQAPVSLKKNTYEKLKGIKALLILELQLDKTYDDLVDEGLHYVLLKYQDQIKAKQNQS